MADDIASLGYDIDSSQARTAAGDLDKLNAASARVARGYGSLASASRNLLRDERGKFMSAQSAAEKYASEIDSLRAKYIPMYSASKQLAAGQDEIRRALELGAISSKQANAAMSALEAQYGVTGRAAQVMGTQVRGASAHTTNLMFQFQDIAMMLAAGQNPLMLAMQQGTQVSGVFQQMKNSGQSAFSGIRAGLLAMVSPMALMTIGTIAGVAALTQWAASAWGAGDSADNFDDNLDALESVMNRVNVATNILSMSAFDLSEKYGMAATRVKELAMEEAILAEGAASRALQETVTTLDSLITRYNGATQSGRSYRNAIKRINKELGLGADEAVLFAVALNDMANASGTEEQIDAANRLRLIFEQNNIEISELPVEIQEAITKANQLEVAAINVESALSRAAQAGANLTASLPMTTGIPLFNQGLVDLLPPETRDKREKGGGGRGGGGRGDTRARELEAFIASLQTERETLEMWRIEQLELLSQYNDAELEAIGGKNEAKLRLEQEYQEQLVQLKQQEAAMVRSAASGMYGELTSLLSSFGQQSKAAAIAGIAINTALRISETIQNTAAASVRALAELGPIAGVAAAAKIKAYGAAQVGLIAANGALRIGSAGGGGGSGGSSAAPSSASGTTATQSQPERVVRVAFDGPDWVQGIIEPLMTQIYEQTGDGTKVVFAK